jgi:N-acyl homoserine lactone hydrolase
VNVVLTGDACYLRRTLEDLHLSSVVYDEAGMRQALRRLRVLRDAGARIFYGHDPEFWETVLPYRMGRDRCARPSSPPP